MKTLALLALLFVAPSFADGFLPSQLPDHVQIQITAGAGQGFIVCADQVKGDQSVILMPDEKAEPTDKPSSTQLISTLNQTRLHLIHPKHCSPESTQNYPYHGKLVHSEKPFLEVISQVNRKKNEITQNQPYAAFMLPFSTEPATNEGSVTGGAGSFGKDDSQDHKRSPWMPFSVSSDFSLTLLPNLRLPEGLSNYLPDLRTWYYLLDSRARTERYTLLLRVEGQSSQPDVIPITISRYEQQELMQHLTGAQQLLTWLTPKLNGREALAHQLLIMQSRLSAANQAQDEMSEPVQALIRKRLAELFDMPDREFSLVFEQFRLGRDLVDVYGDLTSHRPDTGTIYREREVSRLIRQTPNGKETESAKSSGGNKKQDSGTHTSHSGKGIHEKERNSQDDKPSVADQPGHGAQADADSPLTINFIGQRNSGKSSLANSLLNYTHFPVRDSETREIEKDVHILPVTSDGQHQIRIRSLPGYGGSLPGYKWLEEYTFEFSDIVIFVSMGSIDVMDRKIIKGLLDSGFPLRRILFVRNQFDKALAPILQELGVQDDSGRDADKARKKLEKTFNEDFSTRMAKIPGVDASELRLHFTSVADVCENDGVYLLMKSINEQLLSHERSLWKEFIRRRLEFSGDIYHRISSWFIEKVKSGGEATFYSLLNEMSSIHKHPGVNSFGADAHRVQFEALFGVNPEHKIAAMLMNKEALFNVETGAAVRQSAENEQARLLSDMARTVSDEISQRGFWGKFKYLLREAGVRETLYQYFKGAETEARDEAGARAKLVIRQQVDERKSNIIKRSKMHDWYDWMTTSSERVIDRIIPKVEAIVQARLSKKTVAVEPPAESINPSALEQLEKNLGHLAHQFTRYYVTRFYGPAIYQKPLTEEPEPEAFTEIYSPEADALSINENSDYPPQIRQDSFDSEYDYPAGSGIYEPLAFPSGSEPHNPDTKGDYQSLASSETAASDYETPVSQNRMDDLEKWQDQLRESILAIGDRKLDQSAEDAAERLNKALNDEFYYRDLQSSDLKHVSQNVMTWLESVEQFGLDRIIDAMRSYCHWISSGSTPEQALLEQTQWLNEDPLLEVPMIRGLQEGLNQLSVTGQDSQEAPAHDQSR